MNPALAIDDHPEWELEKNAALGETYRIRRDRLEQFLGDRRPPQFIQRPSCPWITGLLSD
jgi:hypothetical protein